MAIAEELQLDPGAAADAAFGVTLVELSALPVAEAVARSSDFERRLAAFQAELLASQLRAGATNRDNENTVGRGTKTSKKEAAKRARRAGAVHENPELADKLADGQLGEEQLDALAAVSAKSDGEAANDQTLITRVENAAPDEAARITREWLDDHNTDSCEDRYRRQRRQRNVRKFLHPNGNTVIRAEGDDETIAEMWTALRGRANHTYEQDGGRDTPVDKHSRSHDQRMYDALHHLLTRRDGKRSAGSKAMVHVHLTVDDESGGWIARTGDGARLPTSVLDRYRCTATFVGTVFDTRGQILFHGRNRRHATHAQIEALIARDKGCVLCAADPNDCVAHHTKPWTAPLKGESNVDELALVCDDCHHLIHDTHQTLHWDPEHERWRPRAATPDEIPARRPAGPASETSDPAASARTTTRPDRRNQPVGQRSRAKLET